MAYELSKCENCDLPVWLDDTAFIARLAGEEPLPCVTCWNRCELDEWHYHLAREPPFLVLNCRFSVSDIAHWYPSGKFSTDEPMRSWTWWSM